MTFVEIIAHRGFHLYEVENSIPAFKEAIKEGADAIELDVHLTRDGKIVVFHDFDIKRIFGIDRKILDMTWEELSNMKFPGKNYGIPLLEDVFREIENKLYIEVKTMDDMGRRYYTNIIDSLRDLMLDVGRKDDIIISFDPLPLLYSKKFSEIKNGLDIDEGSKKLIGENTILVLIDAMDYILPNRSLIGDFLKYGRERIIAWPINDISSFEQLEHMGIAGIITDRIDLLGHLR